MFFILFMLICHHGTQGANGMNENKEKIIIDNDAGGDDAMAIFIALLFEKYFNGPNIVALTTVNGNAAENNVYYNNQRILKVAKRQDVPIYRGSRSALVVPAKLGGFYGVDGLGDIGENVTDLVPAQDKHAVTAMIELSKIHEGNLIVVSIGPVTNIGLAIALDPGFLGRLKHLYIGAGHIYSENQTRPEFNARTDPESYFIITRNANPDKVTIVPFSQVMDTLDISKEWRLGILGAIDTNMMRAQNKYEQVSIPRRDTWPKLDPAAVAIALKSDLVKEFKYSKNNIILEGDKRGRITNEIVDKEDANVRMFYSGKLEEYKSFLLDVFSKE